MIGAAAGIRQPDTQDQVAGQAQPHSGAPAVTTPPQPAGAYLQSLTVSGFRGIGQAATLAVTPSPGLTLVVGRNGSGKSSFAEALEVLLTGNLRRWEKLPAVWRQGWRSVHNPDHVQITAEFLVEGTGHAVAQRTWPTGADFTRASVSVQVAGEKQAGIERLGWSTALADYRPFLSHSELEAFFGSPSGLNELLVSVLGLEDLAVAATRLAQAVRPARPQLARSVSGCRACSADWRRPAMSAQQHAAARLRGVPGTWPPRARLRSAPRCWSAGVTLTGCAASPNLLLRPKTMLGRPRMRSGAPRPG